MTRNIEAAQGKTYDLVVVGGGIYGMMLALEAARRGLKPLLLERGDFGGATSLNSLRILHGGLRYLQSFDLPRFFESVKQRKWFMEHFAPLCRQLPCLMPLYGKGLKWPSIMRLALGINDTLSSACGMQKGKLIKSEEVIERFPNVRRKKLKGGALWYDGQILSPQRLHFELLRWAVSEGATVLNYVEALELRREGSKVAGVVTSVGEFSAPIIFNAAGPWCREVSVRFDRDYPELMTPTLAFNVVLKVPPPCEAAVAVESSRVYFVTPHGDNITVAGTVHKAWQGESKPTSEMLDEFLEELNRAIPGWGVKRSDILRVTAGVLPSKGPRKADMAHRPTFVKHDISGLYSLCGVKYTTAQRFAIKCLNRVFGVKKYRDSCPDLGERSNYWDTNVLMNKSDEKLVQWMKEESVTCPEDVLERRMDWIIDEDEESVFRKRITQLLAMGKELTV